MKLKKYLQVKYWRDTMFRSKENRRWGRTREYCWNVKEDTNGWKHSTSQIRELDVPKCSGLQSQSSSYEITACRMATAKLVLKVFGKVKDTKYPKRINLEKKSLALTLPNCKILAVVVIHCDNESCGWYWWTMTVNRVDGIGLRSI